MLNAQKVKVFISFSQDDQELANRLHTGLSGCGADVFQFQHSARPGSDAWEQVLRSIEQADWFIVLMTSAALESRAVNAEIGHAYFRNVNHGKPKLTPVMVENVKKPRKLETPTDLPFVDSDKLISDLAGLLELPLVNGTQSSRSTEKSVTTDQVNEDSGIDSSKNPSDTEKLRAEQRTVLSITKNEEKRAKKSGRKFILAGLGLVVLLIFVIYIIWNSGGPPISGL